MGGSSKSERTQVVEGDTVFNNIDYGGQGSGAGPLKNFNVGRENTLEDNVFNITDGGATKNALAAGVQLANSANETVREGAKFALGSNEAVSKRAIDNNTATAFKGLDTAVDLAKINQQVSDGAIDNNTATAFKGLDTAVDLAKINQQVSDGAIDAVTGTTSEAIKASNNAQELAAKQARESTAAAFGFAKDSNRQISNLASRSQEKAYDLSREAIGTYEDLVGETGDQVTDAQVTSAQATGKALDYVFESSKSASERQSENLIKYGMYGAVGIVGLISLATVMRR